MTELARRNEELARAHEQEASAPEAPLSRWQLERLKRELERARDRLAQDSGQQSARSNPQTGSQSTPSPSATSPRPGANGRQSAAEHSRYPRGTSTALAKPSNGPSPQRTQTGLPKRPPKRSDGGADALRQAADQLRQDQHDSLTAALQDAQQRAAGLVDEQARILERIEALKQEVLEAVREGRTYTYRGSDFDDEAAAKRRMREDVEQIADDVSELRGQLAQSSSDDGNLTRLLDRTLDDLTDSRLPDLLTMGADYLEMGRPLFFASRELRVHDALNRLSNRLGHALEQLESADANPAGAPTVADVQALRRQLTGLGPGGDPRDLRDIADATSVPGGGVARRRRPTRP